MWKSTEELEKTIEDLKGQLKLEKEQKEDNTKHYKELIDQAQKEKAQVQKDFESEKRILENELKVKISEATEAEKQKSQIVNQENAVLRSKVEILEKAFDNMGFDVKDMKDILNKLVDGLIAKNEIKLVK